MMLTDFQHWTLKNELERGTSLIIVADGDTYLISDRIWIIRCAASDPFIETIDDDQLPRPNDENLRLLAFSSLSDDGRLDGLDPRLVCYEDSARPAEPVRRAMRPHVSDVEARLTDALFRNTAAHDDPLRLIVANSPDLHPKAVAFGWFSVEQLDFVGVNGDQVRRIGLRTRRSAPSYAGTLTRWDEHGCLTAILAPMQILDDLGAVIGAVAYGFARAAVTE